MKATPELASDLVAAAYKVTPPVAVTVATSTGAIDPQWVVAIPTVIFVGIQAAYLAWKWRNEWKERRDKRAGK